ncbi:MAG TPA: universal stress protein [Candidatus Dormibacteraeota bacterium]|nr:universal stress protein [Candidatus Dormibacteraeota bacterium]
METARVYVCVDGSHASLEAARLAVGLARRWRSRLRVVYVVENDSNLDGAPDAETLEHARHSGGAILDRIGRLSTEAGVDMEEAVLEGVPFEVILDDARAWKADVIIMGRTGRTGPGRALLGSEAERVLEFSDRPVLIVPTTEPAG